MEGNGERLRITNAGIIRHLEKFKPLLNKLYQHMNNIEEAYSLVESCFPETLDEDSVTILRQHIQSLWKSSTMTNTTSSQSPQNINIEDTEVKSTSTDTTVITPTTARVRPSGIKPATKRSVLKINEPDSDSPDEIPESSKTNETTTITTSPPTTRKPTIVNKIPKKKSDSTLREPVKKSTKKDSKKKQNSNTKVERELGTERVYDRLCSFRQWTLYKCPVTNAINPSTLSAAGFIHRPRKLEPDRCECTFCKVLITAWEDNDDPIVEHLRISPDCKLAQRIQQLKENKSNKDQQDSSEKDDDKKKSNKKKNIPKK